MTALGLWSIQDFFFFFVACRIFRCGLGTLSCSMWDQVPWARMEPEFPVLGLQFQPLDQQGSPKTWISYLGIQSHLQLELNWFSSASYHFQLSNTIAPKCLSFPSHLHHTLPSSIFKAELKCHLFSEAYPIPPMVSYLTFHYTYT